MRVQLFNLTFEMAADEAKDSLCFGLSTCGQSFAMSSQGVLRAKVETTGSLTQQSVMEVELTSVSVSVSRGLSLTTKLGVWDGLDKRALTALRPLSVQGVGLLAGRLKLGPFSFAGISAAPSFFKDVSLEISSNGRIVLDTDLSLDEVFDELAGLAKAGTFDFQSTKPGYAIVSESQSRLFVRLSKDPQVVVM